MLVWSILIKRSLEKVCTNTSGWRWAALSSANVLDSERGRTHLFIPARLGSSLLAVTIPILKLLMDPVHHSRSLNNSGLCILL